MIHVATWLLCMQKSFRLNLRETTQARQACAVLYRTYNLEQLQCCIAAHAYSVRTGYVFFGTIVADIEQCTGMAASLQQSGFLFSLMLLPDLYYRHDCLVEKQPTVKSLDLLQRGITVSKSCSN